MYSIEYLPKYINIDMQMQIRKIVYLSEYKKSSRYELLKNTINLPRFENSDKTDNYGSLYVQDFEIKTKRDNNIILAKECIFNTIPENNSNPFLVYAKSNNLHKKKIIDLRNVKNTEEPDYYLLNDILSK